MGVPLYTQEIPHTVHYGCAVHACEHVYVYLIVHAHYMCAHEQSMDHISLNKRQA